MNEGPAPGWYPNPTGAGHRYWDGTAWTEHVHDPPAEIAPTDAAQPSGPAVEPTPTDEPAAVEPAPTVEPAAVEPTPTDEPAAVEPAPTVEPAAVEPAPTVEPAAVEPAPTVEPAVGIEQTVAISPEAVAAAGDDRRLARAERRSLVDFASLLAGAGGVVMVVSLFFPWADGFGSANAFSSDLPFPVGSGLALLFFAIATLLAVGGYLATGSRALAGTVVALGVVGALWAVWSGVRFEDEAGGAGIGVWIWLVGAGMAIAGGLLAVTNPPARAAARPSAEVPAG